MTAELLAYRGCTDDQAPCPAARAGTVAHAMANFTGELPLTINIDGRRRPADTGYAWAAGGLTLTISTVIPERRLAFELHSTYTAGPDTDTIAVHLVLGHGRESDIDTCRHPREELNPCELARACAYDHAQRLIDALSDDGHQVTVALDEQTFTALEHVE